MRRENTFVINRISVCFLAGKAFRILLLLAVLFPFIKFNLSFATGAEELTDELEIDAKAAILMDRRSGRVLFAKNENEMLPIASTTKIMTALLAIEQCDPDEMVTASERASTTPGTSIYLGLAEQLTMDQMLQSLMLRSANDAAVAIAEHIDGSVEQFSERMNERAWEIGADAQFMNPHGLDEDGHCASAYGMAKIACAALENERFRQYVTTKHVTIPWRDSVYDRVLSNKNKLLSIYEGATGVKTGFTDKAGRSLVFSAERGGMELVGVLLNCGTWFDSAAKLLDWAFERYTPLCLAEADSFLTEIPVLSGEYQVLEVIPKVSIIVPVAREEEVILCVDVPEQMTAPIEKDTAVGIARVEIDGASVLEVPLYARETVGEWGYFPALKKVARTWFGYRAA